jgi:hypothetical protein
MGRRSSRSSACPSPGTARLADNGWIEIRQRKVIQRMAESDGTEIRLALHNPPVIRMYPTLSLRERRIRLAIHAEKPPLKQVGGHFGAGRADRMRQQGLNAADRADRMRRRGRSVSSDLLSPLVSDPVAEQLV